MKGAAWHPPRRRALGLDRILSVRHVLALHLDWPVLGLALTLLSIGLYFVSGMERADASFDRTGVDFHGHLEKGRVVVFAAGTGNPCSCGRAGCGATRGCSTCCRSGCCCSCR